MPLPEDWRRFIESLNSNGVEYPRVNFLGREALNRNKRLTGRAQDKADLEALGAGEEG